jgi:hypothetical protein
VLSPEELRVHVPDERVEQIKQEAQSVREKFEEPMCSKKKCSCQHKKLRMGWATRDTASMASKVGGGMKNLYYDCYFQPTLLTHTTFQSMSRRVEMTEEGKFSFQSGAQRNDARNAVMLAHLVMIDVLDTQNKYFKLGLDEEMNARIKDFDEAWNKPVSGEEAG